MPPVAPLASETTTSPTIRVLLLGGIIGASITMLYSKDLPVRSIQFISDSAGEAGLYFVKQEDGEKGKILINDYLGPSTDISLKYKFPIVDRKHSLKTYHSITADRMVLQSRGVINHNYLTTINSGIVSVGDESGGSVSIIGGHVYEDPK
jgi:hypothetical protein